MISGWVDENQQIKGVIMKLHPRERIVKKASRKLWDYLAALEEELTEGEYMRVITERLSYEWNMHARYMIREERHPGEPDREGGLE